MPRWPSMGSQPEEGLGSLSGGTQDYCGWDVVETGHTACNLPKGPSGVCQVGGICLEDQVHQVHGPHYLLQAGISQDLGEDAEDEVGGMPAAKPSIPPKWR